VLKKWLEFEKNHGDEEGERGVLDRARQFVEERSQREKQVGDGGEGGDDDDDDDDNESGGDSDGEA
jgi:hypothetical protein